MDINTISEYMDDIVLDDYDLGGVEITEDDFETILERVNNSGRELSNIVHEYLLEIREVLDMGLED